MSMKALILWVKLLDYYFFYCTIRFGLFCVRMEIVLECVLNRVQLNLYLYLVRVFFCLLVFFHFFIWGL